MPLDTLESINPPFSSSPIDEIREAFQKIGLSSQDVLLELGCGEGHNLVLAAEEFGAEGIGYEFLDSLYDRAKENVEDRGLQESILLRKQSLYELQEEDLERSTVAYLYLSNTANQILEPVLKQYSIKILTRIFDLPTKGKKLTEQIKLYDDLNNRCKQPKIAQSLVKILLRKDQE
ncbi:MAG: class I SAM-dependent methyltransferase [Archaeoglobaceae archaeon]